MKNKIYCVIPARSGSKRIPRKNIKNFCGTPMLVRAINIALESSVFNEVIVNTDDINIANIAKKAGANVPFLRPKELADDFSTSISVIKHFANNYNNLKDEDAICLLYATTPFLKTEDLQNAITIFNSYLGKKMIFAAKVFPHPIQRAFVINKSDEAKMLEPDNKFKRTQDLKDTFFDAGQFYISKSSDWKSKDLSLENGIPMVMPKWSCIDIDNLEDWEYSEILYEVLIKKGNL